MRKQTIKNWEIETGIKILNPKGFGGMRNKIRNILYSQEAFRKCAKNSVISIKTDKGITFMEGRVPINSEFYLSLKRHSLNKNRRQVYAKNVQRFN